MIYFYNKRFYNYIILEGDATMFNTKLRELRNYKGITQAELAKHLDVTQQAVGRWEKAITSPDYETLKKLAAYFNVTTDYLLGLSDQPQGTGFQKELLGDTTQDSHIVMTSNALGDSDTDDIQRRYSQLDEAGKAAVKNLMSIFENAKKTN